MSHDHIPAATTNPVAPIFQHMQIIRGSLLLLGSVDETVLWGLLHSFHPQ